jgi:hypothetical protein
MYAPWAGILSNDYVLNGYEASFGSYDVNEKAHTVTRIDHARTRRKGSHARVPVL